MKGSSINRKGSITTSERRIVEGVVNNNRVEEKEANLLEKPGKAGSTKYNRL